MIFHLFKKKREIVKINLKDIDSWIQKTIESKNLGLKIGIFKRELNSKRVKLKELLADLDESRIKDESVIPERAKNMFEGNKKSYIQKISLFLDKIDFPNDISEIESFLEKLSEDLESLAHDTNKNFFIIKEFVEDDVRIVASKLKELDVLISSIRSSIEKSALGKFSKLKELISTYNDTVLKLEDDSKMLEGVLKAKVGELDRLESITSKIELLKKSKHHDEFFSIESRKKVLEEEIKVLEYSLINLFSGISSVLKKFSKKKKNEVASAYSDNAVSALVNDSGFEIFKVLESAIKIKDSLDLKDSKLNKFEAEVEAIQNADLKKLRKDILSKRQDLVDISNRFKNHSFKLNLMELEGRKSSVEQNILDIEREIEELENIIERNNPRLIKQKMRDLIKEIDEYTELI
ncbi:MAG: hypothetical protein ACLFN8_03805 [Candidatus Woesearchaeota archaeon]